MPNIPPQFVKLWDNIILNGPSFLLTLLFFITMHFILGIMLSQTEKRLVEKVKGRDRISEDTRKRVSTLVKLLNKLAFTVLWGIACLSLLKKAGVDTAPILASAGVVGLAIGFGAQNLARDLISGIFILTENSIRVEDVAEINGVTGVVEEINIRTVLLRDGTGALHVFPNGSITQLCNKTKDWSAFILDVGVAYREDPDKVMDVMKVVAAELRQDPAFAHDIIDNLEMWGVDNFAESSVVIKSRIKTKPGKNWPVGREYRRRLKKEFDKEGIEIPFPHQVLYWGNPSKESPEVLAAAPATGTAPAPKTAAGTA